MRVCVVYPEKQRVPLTQRSSSIVHEITFSQCGMDASNVLPSCQRAGRNVEALFEYFDMHRTRARHFLSRSL